jgi:hypothetical protein
MIRVTLNPYGYQDHPWAMARRTKDGWWYLYRTNFYTGLQDLVFVLKATRKEVVSILARWKRGIF